MKAGTKPQITGSRLRNATHQEVRLQIEVKSEKRGECHTKNLSIEQSVFSLLLQILKVCVNFSHSIGAGLVLRFSYLSRSLLCC